MVSCNFYRCDFHFHGSCGCLAGRNKETHGSQIFDPDTYLHLVICRLRYIQYSLGNQAATIAPAQLAAAQLQVLSLARLQGPFSFFGYGECVEHPGRGPVANQMSATGLRLCAVAQARVAGKNAVVDLARTSSMLRSRQVRADIEIEMTCVGRQGST